MNPKSSCKWNIYSDCSRMCLLAKGKVEGETVMFYHVFVGNRVSVGEKDGCLKIAILDS